MKSQALAKNMKNIEKINPNNITKYSEGFYYKPKTNDRLRESKPKDSHHKSVDAGYSRLGNSNTTATRSNQSKFALRVSLTVLLGTLGNRPSQLRTIYTNSMVIPFQRLHRQSKSTGTNRRRTHGFDKSKFRSYMNATGPGDYNLPTLWGSFHTSTSKMRTSPFFSMGKRCKTPVLSKGHTQDLKGKSKYK